MRGSDDSVVPDWLTRYPPADITPREFESWIGEVLESAGEQLEALTVTVRDRVTGMDGSFEIDVSVRFRWHGFDFLVLVEGKRHSNPIKREVVQALASKLQSVGAQKGVIIATAPFQRGALEFAKKHGIALVSVTEGRYTIETKGLGPVPYPSREAATKLFDIPTFVGHGYAIGSDPIGGTSTVVSTKYPDFARAVLFGIEPDPA